MRREPPTSGIEHDPAELLRRARAIRQRAYAPYSHLRVGAVVATEGGQVFDGVNVENASYRMTTCAEQAAIAAMATAGTHGPITGLAVVGDGEDPCTPCGACRQMIFEFGADAMVYASGDGGRPLVARITELLPDAFGPRRLAQASTSGRAHGGA